MKCAKAAPWPSHTATFTEFHTAAFIYTNAFVQQNLCSQHHQIHATSFTPQHLAKLPLLNHVYAGSLLLPHLCHCSDAVTQQLSCQLDYSSTGAARLTQQYLLCHIHAAAFTPPHSYSIYATAFTPQCF